MRKSAKVIELSDALAQDDDSKWITNRWTKWNTQRAGKIGEWSELQKYLFATDTKTTSNKSLPWTHSTTTPKLTQIRDNLHSNYLSSLFPNDKWLTWEAHSRDAAKKEVADTILAYMENKTRISKFRNTVSDLLYDYIDYGNAFAMPTFEARYNVTETERVTDYVGPKLMRIDPQDIVIDPTAMDLSNSPKIIRSVVSMGQLLKMAEIQPDQSFWLEALEDRKDRIVKGSGVKSDDWEKACQYNVDGFGSLSEYYGTDQIELLEFYGDVYNTSTGELRENRMITVMDRCRVVRDEPISTYGGRDMISHIGWRSRPNNLWAMGPLDNLVGMQYMIDHYINMVSNSLDLKVMPPKKIIGDVEPFEWTPNATIHMDEGGDVQEMAQNFSDVYTTLQYIESIEARMEMYAGAPREAMGIRTPGEKTAFEVQALENAAGRIFQEKITQFEVFMEQLLNDMLELSHDNFENSDIIRIIDDDLGIANFKDITKSDITADGILRPVGARHFAQKSQELQNLVGVFNSPLGQYVAPHTSGLELSRFIGNVVDLRGYEIFRPNIAVQEQQETQMLVSQAQQDVQVSGEVSEEEMMLEQGLEQRAGEEQL